jgi:hypothetical protein
MRRSDITSQNGGTEVVRIWGPTVPSDDVSPMVVPYAASKPADAATSVRVIELQKWLTSHSGIFLRPDGVAGPATSEAYRKVTGEYLPGDPRRPH